MGFQGFGTKDSILNASGLQVQEVLGLVLGVSGLGCLQAHLGERRCPQPLFGTSGLAICGRCGVSCVCCQN